MDPNLQKLPHEVRIMKALNGPNIVKFFEVRETEETLHFVMEYSDGREVFKYLLTHGNRREKEIWAEIYHIVYCAVLDEKCVVHTDSKAVHLLLDADLDMKIAGFVFSKKFTFDKKLNTCGWLS